MTKAPRRPAPVAVGPTWPIRSAWGNGLLLFAVVFGIYWPALGGSFLWDDDGHVTRADLRSLAGLGRIWFEIGATQQYYPLLHTAFWIEHRLWGDSVVGYHLVNVVWHAGAALLFGMVLRRLGVPGAWFAALLFAVHPVCVESVAWISEQKNTLSLLLYLAAAHFYLRFDADRRRADYAWATGFFVLALLTKTVTATLPAALLVIFWWRRGRLDLRPDVGPLLPWFVLGIGAGLLTAWVEQTIIGAKGEAFALGPVERLLLAGRVVWFYFGKLLWPHPLVFVYPRWEIDATAWSQYGYLAGALAVLAGVGWLAVRRGWRAPLAVALLFGGTLVPVLGFFNVYPFLFSYVADHFQYHASLAMFAGGAAGLALLTSRCPERLALFRSAGAALVLVFGALAWRQAHLYRDVFALYEHVLARNPGAWMAHNNLGIALVDAGRVDAALPHYRKALELRPAFAEAENNLGYALSLLRRHEEAVPHLRRAVELHPGYLQARNNLAGALMASGRTEAGVEAFREMVQLYPRSGDARFNLGLALARSGRADEALVVFEEAVRLAPANAQYVLHVGLALRALQRTDEARVQFRRAVELDPDSARVRFTVGRFHLEQGRFREAADELQAAVRLDDSLAEAHGALAAALEALGRLSEAGFHAARARRLQAQAPR